MFNSFNPEILLRDFLSGLGLPEMIVSWLSTLIMVASVLLLAWLAYLFTKIVILSLFTRIVKRSKSVFDDKFLETKMLRRLAMIVPGVVIYYLAGWLLHDDPGWLLFIQKAAAIFIVLFATLTLTAFIEGWHLIWLMLPLSEGRYIKPYVQVLKVIVIFAAALIVISILFKISLQSVVAGLGVATAVLVLIFKDTLLGLAASIQLSTNNMVKIGDWITIPGRNIDGSVIDMTLYTVKVVNFDKTILTVPTYALMTESFQNWKGMEEAGVRRIKREIHIDVRSISLLTPELVDRLEKEPLLEKWLTGKSADIEAVRKGSVTSLTNLGAYREYMVEYLKNHHDIDPGLPVMLRDMPPGEYGLPVEIYCFSAINSWIPYEGVQSAVVDFAYAMAGRFDLQLFQKPAGSDLEALRISK